MIKANAIVVYVLISDVAIVKKESKCIIIITIVTDIVATVLIYMCFIKQS